MERRVVIIEDERDVARLLEFNLQQAGFTVDHGGHRRRGPRGRRASTARRRRPRSDAAGHLRLRGLQDRSAPTRELADIGVLMLTAKGEAEDRILGLEVGADDYVVKPFVVREVVLRVTALANRLAERRARPAQSSGHHDHGRADRARSRDARRAHPAARRRSCARSSTSCSSCSSPIPGRVFSREELLEQVWEMRGDINTRTVDVHVRRLRVSLGPAADVIETVHGFGYRARRDNA